MSYNSYLILNFNCRKANPLLLAQMGQNLFHDVTLLPPYTPYEFKGDMPFSERKLANVPIPTQMCIIKTNTKYELQTKSKCA